MTDRSKFEEMLEHLINEDHDAAKELFHQLVVEKSREIYEGILAEDFGSFNELGEAEDDDTAQDDEIGGDATDDFIDDVENDESEEGEFGDDEGSSEEDLEDRVVDLEDALDELRAEFESLMSGDDEMGSEEGSDDSEGSDDDFNWDDEGSSEEDDEFPAKENFMREYIEKVAAPKHGDNGANTKSPVAKPNHMGGTAANIVKGGESTTGGTKGGLLAPTPKEDDMGNINVPGGNAGKTAFKHKEAGHGAEKKGSADTASNKKSVLGSR